MMQKVSERLGSPSSSSRRGATSRMDPLPLPFILVRVVAKTVGEEIVGGSCMLQAPAYNCLHNFLTRQTHSRVMLAQKLILCTENWTSTYRFCVDRLQCIIDTQPSCDTMSGIFKPSCVKISVLDGLV